MRQSKGWIRQRQKELKKRELVTDTTMICGLDLAKKRHAYHVLNGERESVARGKIPHTLEGVEELIDRVGQDLRRLMGEVDKLEAFGAGERSLSAEDVAAVLGRGLGRPLYLLGDAPGRQRGPAEGVIPQHPVRPRVRGDLEQGVRQQAAVLVGVVAQGPADDEERGRRLEPPVNLDDLPTGAEALGHSRATPCAGAAARVHSRRADDGLAWAGRLGPGGCAGRKAFSLGEP